MDFLLRREPADFAGSKAPYLIEDQGFEDFQAWDTDGQPIAPAAGLEGAAGFCGPFLGIAPVEL
jgi:hypothetical protein